MEELDEGTCALAQDGVHHCDSHSEPKARIITPGCDIFMVRSAKIPTDVPHKSIFRKRIIDNS